MVNHFIKTRFNISFKNPDKKRLEKKWLDYRLDLFLKYCSASVLSQNNENFFWLIGIDKDTSSLFKEKILSIDKRIHLYSCEKECFDVVKVLYDKNEKIFFSRIDSDDAYRKDFISKIQSCDTDSENYMIDINYLCLRLKDFSYYEKKQNFSHFLSFCTKNIEYSRLSTHKQYADLKNSFEYKRIDMPLAIEIIHGDNLYNTFEEKKIKKTDIDLNNYF
jgi:hypothetical protein